MVAARRYRLAGALGAFSMGCSLMGCSAGADEGAGIAPLEVSGSANAGDATGDGAGSGSATPGGSDEPPTVGGTVTGGASGEGTGTAVAPPEVEAPLPPVVESGTDFTGFEVGSEPEPGDGCQQAARSFVPQIPTVFMLVDRSGTMFAVDEDTGVSPWNALRDGALQVIEELQAQVRFGFGAFSGQAGGTCPLMPSESPSLDNHGAIATLYNSLEQPINSKETPTLLAFREVAALLSADETPGAKYVLFVTDGEPDYCDDGAPICPADSVVGLLQELSSATGESPVPINTLVFGVETPQSSISLEVLQAFANAGVGQPVRSPVPLLSDVFYACQGSPGWRTEFARTGKPLLAGQTTGTYSTLGGSARVYRPDPSDQAALSDEIRSALAGVKSCTFDLEGDGVEVDLNRNDLGDLAQVLLNGQAVPFDEVDGWRMLSETTVELRGAACATWRAPEETSLDFDFPCDVIVVR